MKYSIQVIAARLPLFRQNFLGFSRGSALLKRKKSITDVEHNGILASWSGEVASAFSECFSRLFSGDKEPEPVPEEIVQHIPKVSEDILEVIKTSNTL